MRLVIEYDDIMHEQLKLLARIHGQSLKSFLVDVFDSVIEKNKEKYGDLMQKFTSVQKEITAVR